MSSKQQPASPVADPAKKPNVKGLLSTLNLANHGKQPPPKFNQNNNQLSQSQQQSPDQTSQTTSNPEINSDQQQLQHKHRPTMTNQRGARTQYAPPPSTPLSLPEQSDTNFKFNQQSQQSITENDQNTTTRRNTPSNNHNPPTPQLDSLQEQHGSSTGIESFSINDNYFYQSVIDPNKQQSNSSPWTGRFIVILIGFLLVSISFNITYFTQESYKATQHADFVSLSPSSQQSILQAKDKFISFARDNQKGIDFQLLLPEQIAYWSQLDKLHHISIKEQQAQVRQQQSTQNKPRQQQTGK